MMQQHLLGSLSASVVGLGTWGMGGWMWGGADETSAIQAVHAAIDAGINFIDTAPAYGLGLSETFVGKALAGRRDQVILATKCGLIWHKEAGTYFFDEHGQKVYRHLGGDSIRYELEQSLKRLNTDYIDLYQTHWQDATTPIEETMQTLLDLKQEGKIRAIGISNVTPAELEAYRQVGQLDSVQEKYSLLDRQIESTLLPITRQHNIAMLAYSPLSLGLLTGKITPERVFNGDDQRRDDPRFSPENRQRIARMLADLQPIAHRHQATLSQLVIAWTAAQPGITHVLCGARNPAQASENAGAGQIVLSPQDLQTMAAVLQAHVGEIV